jgi:hypothetical protein
VGKAFLPTFYLIPVGKKACPPYFDRGLGVYLPLRKAVEITGVHPDTLRK